MSRIYNCLKEYGEESTEHADALTHTPYAVVAAWRYKYPVTFSRKNQSSTDVKDAATALRDEVLVICDDVANLTLSFSKTNHIGTANINLRPNYNYLTEIFPGDWVAVWIVNGEKAASDLIRRIQKGETCNDADSGFKFLGRALGMRKRLSTEPFLGRKTCLYSLSAASGLEWDAGVYYEPALESVSQDIVTEWLKKTGIAINDIIIDQQTAAGGGISSMKAIPRLMDAFFGSGVPKNEGAISTPGSADTTAGLDSADVFLVPTPVASTLGITKGTKKSEKIGINDITDVLTGIQRYEPIESEDPAELLAPSNLKETTNSAFQSTFGETESRRFECDELLGVFLPSPPQFNGQRTVWQTLGIFVNDAVNEMYYTFRVGPSGRIMPTLVVRQLPFSSGLVSEEFKPKPLVVSTHAQGLDLTDPEDPKKMENVVVTDDRGSETRNIKLTRFSELPRWQIPEILIQDLDVGRSDALRFNFIHVYGSTGAETRQDRAAYIVRDPPVKDEIDIARSGLRLYPKTVACSPEDTLKRKAGDWMYILSDILMGQHMVLTGTMACHGIYAPISIGDNVEYDQHLFHIELLNHTFSVTENGVRTFRTQLALSHGVRINQLAGDDLSLYAGATAADLTRNDGGHSSDLRLSPSKSSQPSDPDTDVFLDTILGK